MTNKKVLVVDLDGTLFRVNTFHYFLKYLAIYYLKNLKLWSLVSLIFLINLRLIRLISHSKFKYFILKQIKNQSIDYNEFVVKISKYKVEFKPVTDKAFTTKILATAAPTCYAGIIAKNEGFNVCLGTDFTESKYNSNFENSKENKKIKLESYLKSNDLEGVNLFITDHIDDAFCIKFAEQNWIVNPDDDFHKWLAKNKIPFKVCNP